MPERSPPSTDDLTALLRARGQRATPQRRVILRELRRRAHHVSAHDVREAIRGELPGTSTPTVYATLDLLAELGLVRKLSLATGTTLYDARVTPHQHTVCASCGRVADLDIALDADAALDAAREHGFVADACELVITGRCAQCAATASGADAVAWRAPLPPRPTSPP